MICTASCVNLLEEYLPLAKPVLLNLAVQAEAADNRCLSNAVVTRERNYFEIVLKLFQCFGN